jgi:hypothetical protein
MTSWRPSANSPVCACDVNGDCKRARARAGLSPTAEGLIASIARWTMRIDYDQDHDTVYIRLHETPATAESETRSTVDRGLRGCSGWMCCSRRRRARKGRRSF